MSTIDNKTFKFTGKQKACREDLKKNNADQIEVSEVRCLSIFTEKINKMQLNEGKHLSYVKEIITYINGGKTPSDENIATLATNASSTLFARQFLTRGAAIALAELAHDYNNKSNGTDTPIPNAAQCGLEEEEYTKISTHPAMVNIMKMLVLVEIETKKLDSTAIAKILKGVQRYIHLVELDSDSYKADKLGIVQDNKYRTTNTKWTKEKMIGATTYSVKYSCDTDFVKDKLSDHSPIYATMPAMNGAGELQTVSLNAMFAEARNGLSNNKEEKEQYLARMEKIVKIFQKREIDIINLQELGINPKQQNNTNNHNKVDNPYQTALVDLFQANGYKLEMYNGELGIAHRTVLALKVKEHSICTSEEDSAGSLLALTLVDGKEKDVCRVVNFHMKYKTPEQRKKEYSNNQWIDLKRIIKTSCTAENHALANDTPVLIAGDANIDWKVYGKERKAAADAGFFCPGHGSSVNQNNKTGAYNNPDSADVVLFSTAGRLKEDDII